MDNSNICKQCGREVFQIHTGEMCGYYQFVKEMEAKKYVSMSDHPDLDELLRTEFQPIKRLWAINLGIVTQGHISYTYYPKWLSDAVELYHEYNYSGMTLTEYLNKMA